MSRSPSISLPVLVALSLILACEGPAGPEGPQGPAGPGTDPSISGVSPGSAFLEHALDVTISGSGTSWSAGATVDFGEGVTVSDVTAASPTALVATILADRTAALGTRSVTVTDQDVATTFSSGFELEAPLAVQGVTGTVAQGSVVLVELRQRDSSTPFDVRSTGGGAEPVRFPYLRTTLERQSLDGSVLEATEFGLAAHITLDVAAASGPATMVVESGPDGAVIPSALPEALDVAPRSPTDVAPGTSETRSVTDSLESLLFSATAGADRLVTMETSPSSPDADPDVFHLREDGRFAGRISGEPPPEQQFVAGTSPRTHYFVYRDPTGTSGYDVTMTAEEFSTESETEPNDDSGSADQLTGAIVAAIGSVGDQDYYSVPATNGQTVRVSSGSGIDDACPQVDPELEILDTDGATRLAFQDDEFCDTASATVDADGTYFIRVAASTDFCADCTFDYSLLIEVQP